MDDLVRWLNEQLDADEQTARAAAEELGPDWYYDGGGYVLTRREDTLVATGSHDFLDQERAEHIAAWDPARVLREIETKRDVLRDLAEVIEVSKDYKGPDYYEGVDACERTLKRMAAVYADHPGYREEWRP